MGSKSVDYMFNFEGKQFVSVFFLIHGLPIAHLIIFDKIGSDQDDSQ